MNFTMQYGFDIERSYNTADTISRFHFCLMVLNSLVLHPTMLFILFKTRKTMHNGIFWAYVFTETGLIMYDWCFYLVGISFAFPYAAIHFRGPLSTSDVSLQMTVLAIGVVAEIPFFFFLQVSMHQNIVAELNPQWRLPPRTKRICVTTFATVLVVNVLGFTMCGIEGDDTHPLYKHAELDWLLSKSGTLIVFGDFGQPQYFGTEIYILLFSLVAIGIPIFSVLFHSLFSLHHTESLTSNSQTHAMIRRTFRVFMLQMLGAFVCCTFPLMLFCWLTIIDTRKMIPPYGFAVLRLGCEILFLLNPCQFCIVFITRSNYARKLLKSIRENESLSAQSNQLVRKTFTNSMLVLLRNRFNAKCSSVKII